MSYKVIGQGEKWTVIRGDVLDYLSGSLWQRQYYGEYFHLLFSDWPYNLDSITKRFGGSSSAPAQFGRDGAFARQSAGFMGARWDTDLAYQPETWQAITPHLYPGAFTASFTHPRKQHRLAMAQEAAGYVMNPALYQLGWCYSSGKPNGTNMGLLLDKRAGVEREVIGLYQRPDGSKPRVNVKAPKFSGNTYNNGQAGYNGNDPILTAPATPLAQIWAGHQYGSPLAPELEPIIIAQAPWKGDRLNTVTTTGAGAVNIEAGKQGMPGRGHPGHLVITHHPGCVYRGEKMIKPAGGDRTGNEPTGQPGYKAVCYGDFGKRTPFTHQVNENGMLAVPAYDCHPDCPAARLDSQTGDEKSYHFHQADWTHEIEERLASTNPVFYHGKVQANERNLGCDDLPLKERRRVNPGGYEREKRFAPTQQRNDHPTLKPIALTKWIAGLFSTPAAYAPRRCLIPTCGTGSEAIGALLSGGFDEIIAVELDPKFADIACRRLSWWSQWPGWGQTDVDKILAVSESELQPSLFG
jgi:hypothetical protein